MFVVVCVSWRLRLLTNNVPSATVFGCHILTQSSPNRRPIAFCHSQTADCRVHLLPQLYMHRASHHSLPPAPPTRTALSTPIRPCSTDRGDTHPIPPRSLVDLALREHRVAPRPVLEGPDASPPLPSPSLPSPDRASPGCELQEPPRSPERPSLSIECPYVRARTTARSHSHSFHRFAMMYIHHCTVRATGGPAPIRGAALDNHSQLQPLPTGSGLLSHLMAILGASVMHSGSLPVPRPRRFVVCCCRRKPQSDRRPQRSRAAGTSSYLVHTDA